VARGGDAAWLYSDAVALESKKRDRRRFPWWPLLLLLVSIYLFWVLPFQRGGRPVEVEFERPSGGK
jgi:hypothetical protein